MAFVRLYGRLAGPYGLRIPCSFCVLAMLLAVELEGQDGHAIASRADQIQAQRMEKARDLHPDEPTSFEKRFVKTLDIVPKIPGTQVHIQLGGLPEGSGIAAGPVIQWDPNGRIRYRAWGVGSIHDFYDVGAGVELPRIATHNLTLALAA